MDDLQMLADALAAPEPSRAVADRSRRRLQRRMRDAAPRRRIGWAASGSSLAGAAAAAAVVLWSGVASPGGTPGEPAPSAARVLLAAATTAARTPEGRGAYWHVATRVAGPGGSGAVVAGTWVGRDGTTWMRGTKTRGRLVRLTQPRPFRLAGLPLTVARLRRLPTRAAALTAWIADAVRHGGGRTSAGRPGPELRRVAVVGSLTALVSQLPAPPRVRAAAFRALAALPGVRSLGAVAGGQGLTIPLPGGRARLVVDPATSRVRGTSFLVTADGAETWLPATRSATVRAGWTDRLPGS